MRRAILWLLIALAVAAAAAAAAALRATPTTPPPRLWTLTLVDADAERAVPGLYVTPGDSRLPDFEGDGSEDFLGVVDVGPPTVLERLLWFTNPARPVYDYRATGDVVREAGHRWVEFAREDDR